MKSAHDGANAMEKTKQTTRDRTALASMRGVSVGEITALLAA